MTLGDEAVGNLKKKVKNIFPLTVSQLYPMKRGLGLFSQAVNAMKATVVVSSLIICTNYLK